MSSHGTEELAEYTDIIYVSRLSYESREAMRDLKKDKDDTSGIEISWIH